MGSTPTSGDELSARWMRGLEVIGLGLSALLVGLVFVLRKFQTAIDVGAVIWVAAAAIGNVVAAYFGVPGTTWNEKPDEARREANAKAVDLVSAVAATNAEEAFQSLRGLAGQYRYWDNCPCTPLTERGDDVPVRV